MPRRHQNELREIENVLILEEEGDKLNAVRGRITVRVATDSGVVKHATHPLTLPIGV